MQLKGIVVDNYISQRKSGICYKRMHRMNCPE